MAETQFITKGQSLRDQYVCEKCGTVPRMRALVEVLSQFRPDWRSCAIHENSPSMPFFSQQCSSYTSSFFYEDVPVGSVNPDGHRCENLEALTFPNETFDIFITHDALEHVFNPDRALFQIMRVLRKGGLHIFTALKHKELPTSVRRALLNNGQVEHLIEPTYLDSPTGDKRRSLVTFDYGSDFDDLIERWSGYTTCNFIIRDRRRGIDGEFLDVFVTTKEPLNFTRQFNP
jgi:SAM-dependent methyltransferase